MRSEVAYQARLVQKIEAMFPGCVVFKNDPREYQGVPDLLILYGCAWAMLEVKRSANEPFQPNQEYYLDLFGDMSYAACIYPENEEQVLNDLQFAFGGSRETRVS